MIQKALYILLILGSFSCSYLPKPIAKNPDLIIEENADYITLSSAPLDNNQSGIIFYPGGLVDPHSYINLFEDFVIADNRTVVIVKVSSNLAILNTQKASAITKEFPAINRWIVGGHSLGGSVACMDLFENPDDFDALFLLAAYSVNDLSNLEIPMLSITASKDNVLDMANFQDNASNLPTEIKVSSTNNLPSGSTTGNTIYYEIVGGNHAQFGNYGTQKGDGEASITVDEQHDLVVQMMQAFLLNNNL